MFMFVYFVVWYYYIFSWFTDYIFTNVFLSCRSVFVVVHCLGGSLPVFRLFNYRHLCIFHQLETLYSILFFKFYIKCFSLLSLFFFFFCLWLPPTPVIIIISTVNTSNNISLLFPPLSSLFGCALILWLYISLATISNNTIIVITTMNAYWLMVPSFYKASVLFLYAAFLFFVFFLYLFFLLSTSFQKIVPTQTANILFDVRLSFKTFSSLSSY